MNPLLKIYEERRNNGSDILAVIEAVEKWTKKEMQVKHYFTDFETDIYNDALSDLLHFLSEAKEEIKNSDKK